jgi:2'-5' RNA ligase/chaperonin cofactor prefoldin
MNTGAMVAHFLSPETGKTLLDAVRPQVGDLELTALDQLHLTIVFLGEADALPEQGNELSSICRLLASQLAPIEGSLNGIGRFADKDPNALYANFDAPGLAKLRELIIAFARTGGIEPVLSHGYSPHVTLAYLAVSAPTPSITIAPIPCLIDSITFARGDEQIVYPLRGQIPVAEMTATPMRVSEMFSFDLPTFSFRDEAGYPDVPVASGVDLAALTAGDPDPLFVTRPLAILDAVSVNGLEYDETLISDIERQIVGKVARQGHVSEETKSWEFPDDVAIWVGVKRMPDVLLGKAYIYPGTHFNTMVRKRKAAGGELSNSIWGKSSFIETANGTVRSIGLRMESCDFVPAERASLQDLGGKFQLTSEMEAPMPEPIEEVSEMDTFKKKLAEMAPDSLYEMLSEAQRQQCAEMRIKECDGGKVYEMLSEMHRQHVAETHSASKSMKLVPKEETTMSEGSIAEMQTQIAEMTALKTQLAEVLVARNQDQAQIAEMQATLKRYAREEFDRSLDNTVAGYFADWRVSTEDGKQKLEAVKKNLRVLTVAEMAGSTKPEDIKPAAEKAWANVKPLAEMTLASLAGPSAFVGVTTASGAAGGNRFGFDPNTGRYSNEAVTAAIQRTNIMGGREGRTS